MKKRIVVAPGSERLADVCSPGCRELLEKTFDVVWNDGPELSSEQLTERLPGAYALLTSWGSAPISDEALDLAKDLKVIGHAAGTLKGRIPESVLDRDITVFSAASRIAESVGEYCMTAVFQLLRQVDAFDSDMRLGNWRTATVNGSKARGQELRGRQIGLIGASSTARAFLRMLAPFDVRVKVYDPYLSEENAAELGVQKASLDDVMSSEIVSLHVPAIPETHRMVGAQQLSHIPDGGILINSARGASIDEKALFSEIASGRIKVALDVFDQEPPALPAPIRKASNVMLTPHVAGDTVQGHLALMEYVTRDIVDWVESGVKGASFVDLPRWNVTA